MNFRTTFGNDANRANRFNMSRILGVLPSANTPDSDLVGAEELLAFEQPGNAHVWMHPYGFSKIMEDYVSAIGRVKGWDDTRTKAATIGKLMADWVIDPERRTGAVAGSHQTLIMNAVRHTPPSRQNVQDLWVGWIARYRNLVDMRALVVAAEQVPEYFRAHTAIQVTGGYAEYINQFMYLFPRSLLTAAGQEWYNSILAGRRVDWPQPAAGARRARRPPNSVLGVERDQDATAYYVLELPELLVNHDQLVIPEANFNAAFSALTDAQLLEFYNCYGLIMADQQLHEVMVSAFTMTAALSKSGNCTETWFDRRVTSLVQAAPAFGNKDLGGVELIRSFYNYFCLQTPPSNDQLYLTLYGVAQLCGDNLHPLDWIAEQAKVTNIASAMAFAEAVNRNRFLTHTVLNGLNIPAAQFTAFARLVLACVADPYCCATRPVVPMAEYPDLAYIGCCISFGLGGRNRRQNADGYKGTPNARASLGKAELEAFSASIQATLNDVVSDVGSVRNILRAYNIVVNHDRNGYYEGAEVAEGEGGKVYSSVEDLVSRIVATPRDVALRGLCSALIAAGQQQTFPVVADDAVAVPNYRQPISQELIAHADLFNYANPHPVEAYDPIALRASAVKTWAEIRAAAPVRNPQ